MNLYPVSFHFAIKYVVSPQCAYGGWWIGVKHVRICAYIKDKATVSRRITLHHRSPSSRSLLRHKNSTTGLRFLMFLPALTWVACRTRVKVMNALSVESISHRFVFHLVEHLCISMVGRPHKRIKLLDDFRWFLVSLPQSQLMMETFLQKSHKWGVLASSLSHNEAPDPPPRCPAFTVKVVGL